MSLLSSFRRPLIGSVMLASVLALSGCGGIPTNRYLVSTHQPVVSHSSFALDLNTGPGGLTSAEQQRLEGWFAAMNLKYGDHVAIEDPIKSEATRAGISASVARFGLQISRDVPLGEGTVNAGITRVVITRAKATVPGCPDWSSQAENNLTNGTSSNYGCAINSNLAAMVADPDHLLAGARGASQTVVMTSNKAIDAYRNAKPSGEGGTAVKKVGTSGSN